MTVKKEYRMNQWRKNPQNIAWEKQRNREYKRKLRGTTLAKQYLFTNPVIRKDLFRIAKKMKPHVWRLKDGSIKHINDRSVLTDDVKIFKAFLAMKAKNGDK